jgi:hypothetical protein
VAQDEAGAGRRRQATRVQEDPRALHQLRQAAEAREDQLGHAPVPPRLRRAGARRRARRVQGLLPDAAKAAIKDPAGAHNNNNNPPVVVHKGFEANVAEEYCYNSAMMIGYGQGVPNNNDRADHFLMPNFAAVHAARATFGP